MSLSADIDSKELEKRIIAVTEAGLPLSVEPYVKVAELVGAPPEQVMAVMQRMLECGSIRRIAAVPNHYRLGFRANGMTVWDVEDSVVDVLGSQVGQLDYVTHCYRRPRHLPGWRFNLFAMVHAETRSEVLKKADEIRAILGSSLRGNDVLFSKRILKKTGYRTREGAR